MRLGLGGALATTGKGFADALVGTLALDFAAGLAAVLTATLLDEGSFFTSFAAGLAVVFAGADFFATGFAVFLADAFAMDANLHVGEYRKQNTREVALLQGACKGYAQAIVVKV